MIQTTRQLNRFLHGHFTSVIGFSFVTKGKSLIVVDGGDLVYRYDVTSWVQDHDIHDLEGQARTQDISVSPDGNTLAVCRTLG